MEYGSRAGGIHGSNSFLKAGSCNDLAVFELNDYMDHCQQEPPLISRSQVNLERFLG